MEHPLILFAITEFFLSLSPGPAVLLIVSLSFRGGKQFACMAIAGILFTNTMFFILSALGVGTVLASSQTLFNILKYAGCAFLVWTAIGILFDVWINRRNTGDQLQTRNTSQNAAGLLSAFVKGVAIQASSVKNLVIFVSIIPQFVDTSQPVLIQFVKLGIVSLLVEAPILFAYAFASSKLAGKAAGKLSRLMDIVAAILLIFIAGAVVATR